MHVLVTIVLAIVPLGVLVWRAADSRHNSRNLPPGPPADPIIGHVRKVPTSRPELAYKQWAQEYSELVLALAYQQAHCSVGS